MLSLPVRTADFGRASPALVRALPALRPSLAPARTTQPPSFAALLSGQWSVLDRVEAAGLVHLVASARTAPPERTCASRQAEQARAALELATRGVANKVIALELEVSQSTVTRMITRALNALRLVDVREAMALAQAEPTLVDGEPLTCTWSIDATPRCTWSNLTYAERDIVQRILRHASRAQIAEARGTSLFTVNSQIATIFAKLRVTSKRELLQRAAGR